MKVEKIKFTVEIEVLFVDVIPAMLIDIAKHVQNEQTSGTLRCDDGDQMQWDTEKQPPQCF